MNALTTVLNSHIFIHHWPLKRRIKCTNGFQYYISQNLWVREERMILTWFYSISHSHPERIPIPAVYLVKFFMMLMLEDRYPPPKWFLINNLRKKIFNRSVLEIRTVVWGGNS